jgi:hypothetical protein
MNWLQERFTGDGGIGRTAGLQLLPLPEPRLPPRRHHLQGLPGEDQEYIRFPMSGSPYQFFGGLGPEIEHSIMLDCLRIVC